MELVLRGGNGTVMLRAPGTLLPGWKCNGGRSVLCRQWVEGLSQGDESRAAAALVVPAEKSAWRCLWEQQPSGFAGSWLWWLNSSPPLEDLASQSKALTSGFN